MKFNRTFVLLLALLSVLTSCGQKDVPTDLDAYQMDRSAEQILKQVKRDGFVVMEDGDVSVGQEIWRDFYDTARQGKSASVKLATYHTL